MDKVIYGVNGLLMFLIARYQYNSDNDKTIIISSLAVAVVFTFNLILGLFAQMDKKPFYIHYYYAAIAIMVGAVILLPT